MKTMDAVAQAGVAVSGGIIAGFFAILLNRRKQALEDQRYWRTDAKRVYLELLQWSRTAGTLLEAIDSLVGWPAQLEDRQHFRVRDLWRELQRDFRRPDEELQEEARQRALMVQEKLEPRWEEVLELRNNLESSFWANSSNEVWDELELLSSARMHKAAKYHHGSVLVLLARLKQNEMPPETSRRPNREVEDWGWSWDGLGDQIGGSVYLYKRSRKALLKEMRRNLKIKV